jgi:hypothetical protein
MDWFVRFLLPIVALLIVALLYEIVRSAGGRRLTMLDATIIVVLIGAIIVVGGWSVAEWLPSRNMVTIGKHG